eukprot:1606551-Lingulodinium_polyedra.AAC.1
MGGTASTLLWAIGYDPIVYAVRGPTYVDDLAGLTVGIEQTLRLHYFLLVAGHAAGLRIAPHSCVALAARAVHPAVEQALRWFPAQCSWRRGIW